MSNEMHGFSRRAFTAGVAGAATLGALRPRVAHAAPEFRLKFASVLPPEFSATTRAVEAAKKISAQTDGRVEIQVFPASQLGGDGELLAQVRSGAIELYQPSAVQLGRFVPLSAIGGTGFAFTSYDQVWAAMDGPLGSFVNDAIGKANLTVVGKVWDSGFRQITSSSRQIKSPADLKGFKIRVPVSPLWTSLFQHLGASPVAINFAELYTSLQTGVADGQENGLSIIDSGKLYEVQKFCFMTNHMWDGYFVVANNRAWGRLPKDLQAIIVRNFNEGVTAQREDLRKASDSLVGNLRGRGMTFEDLDNAPFRKALQASGFYAEWRKTFGEEGWALLEKTTGKLT